MFDFGPLIAVAGISLACAYVCFQKGKTAFGWLSLAGMVPFFWYLGIFGVVGAIRYAKPDSAWAQSRYLPAQMEIARQRFPSPIPSPPPKPVNPSLSPDSEVIVDFLERAGRANVIDLHTQLGLLDFLENGVSEPSGNVATPSEKVDSAQPESVEDVAPEPIETTTPTEPLFQPPPSVGATPRVVSPSPPPSYEPPETPRPTPPRHLAPSQPGRLSNVVAKTWDAVASDLALHGFAYLGVILTFVGVLGFLLFAFVDLPDAAKPLVELFIAITFFGWAWFLRLQQAHHVAIGMELIGGMVIPLILFASLADPVPPQFIGGGLVVALTITSFALAVVYAWITSRTSETTLRSLVAPLVWLGAMTIGFVFKTDEVLVRTAITRLVSPQPALASAAITLTLVAALYRRRHRLSAPTVRSSLVGVPVAYLLTISLAVGEDWVRVWPIALLGVATLLSAELLAVWYEKQEWMDVARPILLAGAVGPFVPILGLGWAGLVVGVAYGALYEWERRQRTGLNPAALLNLTGVAAGLAMSIQEPVSALLSFALASAWAQVRRVDEQEDGATGVFNAAAATLPFGVFVALVELFGTDPAWLIMASLVTGLTVVLPRLDLEDPYWTNWLVTASLVIGLGAAAQWVDAGGSDIRSAWTLALVTVSLAIGRKWPVARLWIASAAGSSALAMALATLDVAVEVQQGIWAGTGLAAVVAAAVWRKEPVGHLAAIGHVVATATVVSLLGGGEETLALTGWAAGWLASTYAREAGGATMTSLLSRLAARSGARALEGVAGWVVPLMFVITTPIALLAVAETWQAFGDHRSWTGVLMASIGLGYARPTRLRGLSSPLRRSLGMGAVVTSVIGVSVAAPDPWPTIYAAVALIAVAALVSGDLRQVWFVWVAWSMTNVLVLMLAERAGVESESLHLVSLGWGGVMLLGGLIQDDFRSGRRDRGEGLRTDWLRYPVLLGSLVVPLSLGPTFVEGASSYGWWAVAVAVVYLAVAWLLRAGSVTGPAYALAALGLTVLSPWSLTDEPWRFIFLAAPMVALSWLSESRQSEASGGWLRWDLAPLVVAHGVAVVAVAFAAVNGGLAATAFVFGVLSIVVGLWRRQRAWDEVGNVMIVLGAWDLGQEWLALALALTSLRGVIGVRLATERSRLSYHLIAVLGAGLAWVTFLDWLGIEPLEAANYSILVFGGLGLSTGAGHRRLAVREDTWSWWSGLAVLGAIAASVYALRPDGPGIEGPWFSIGLVGLAAGFEVSATGPKDRPLQLASVATVGLAWLAMIVGAEWARDDTTNYTSLVFGGLALVASALGRVNRIGPQNAIRWGALGVVGVLMAGLIGLEPEVGVAADGPALAIGLAATAVASDLGWPFTHMRSRYVAVAMTGLAWVALASGLGWETMTSATRTAVGFGLLALGVIELTRLRGTVQTRDVARAWALLGATGLIVAAVLYAMADTELIGYPVAGILAVLAVAGGRGARPLQIDPLRDGSVIAGLGSALTLAWAAGWPDVWIAGSTLVVAAAATFLSLAVWTRQPNSLWLRPIVVLSTASNLIAALLAGGQLPERALSVGALLSFGVQAIAVGLTTSLPQVLAIGPPLLGVAFVFSIGESVGGSAQWHTVPLGLVLLSEIEIMRTMPRFTNREGDGRNLIVLLEWVGLGILSAPPLVEMFTVSLFTGLGGIAVAVAVFLWGVATRVRRRVVAAAALAVATTVLMIFAAAAGGAPDSAFFWILAIGIGFAVMLVAAMVEAYRSKKGKTMARLDELMAGWE